MCITANKIERTYVYVLDKASSNEFLSLLIFFCMYVHNVKPDALLCHSDSFISVFFSFFSIFNWIEKNIVKLVAITQKNEIIQ